MDVIIDCLNRCWSKQFIVHCGQVVLLVVLLLTNQGCSSGGGEDTTATPPPSPPVAAIPTYSQCIVINAPTSFVNVCNFSINLSWFDQGPQCQLLCGPQTIGPGGTFSPLGGLTVVIQAGACAPPYTMKVTRPPPASVLYFCS